MDTSSRFRKLITAHTSEDKVEDVGDEVDEAEVVVESVGMDQKGSVRQKEVTIAQEKGEKGKGTLMSTEERSIGSISVRSVQGLLVCRYSLLTIFFFFFFWFLF